MSPFSYEQKVVKNFRYNYTFYQQDIKQFAKLFLDLLPKNVTHLICSSSSGCAIATAMIVLSEKPLTMIYVRKENEVTHGYPIDGHVPQDKICFVDDVIASGNTLWICYNKKPFNYSITVTCYCDREKFNNNFLRNVTYYFLDNNCWDYSH